MRVVGRLPESWNLPAYITVLIQAANIGPLSYAIVKYLIHKHKPESPRAADGLETGVIFAIIIVGAAATLLLSFFWHVTSIVGEPKHPPTVEGRAILL